MHPKNTFSHCGLNYSHCTKSELRKFYQARKELKQPVPRKKSRIWYVKKLQALDAKPSFPRFMELPKELRASVLRELVVAKPDYDRYCWGPKAKEIETAIMTGDYAPLGLDPISLRKNPEPWLSPQLLRVSTVCYNEVRPLMYSGNDFAFSMRSTEWVSDEDFLVAGSTAQSDVYHTMSMIGSWLYRPALMRQIEVLRVEIEWDGKRSTRANRRINHGLFHLAAFWGVAVRPVIGPRWSLVSPLRQVRVVIEPLGGTISLDEVKKTLWPLALLPSTVQLSIDIPQNTVFAGQLQRYLGHEQRRISWMWMAACLKFVHQL